MPTCFNPRARDGRELIELIVAMLTLSFNPRARDGRETLKGWLGKERAVSIHAPVMDAKAFLYMDAGGRMFQSTRP